MSVFTFLGPMILVGFFIATQLYRRSALASNAALYPEYRLDLVARDLGLTVTSGDPQLNLMLVAQAHEEEKTKAHGNLLQKAIGDTAKETRARAEGVRWGRPYELVYHQRTELENGLTVRTYKLYFDLSLAAAMQVDGPQFEIVIRNPQAYCEPRIETALPAQSTGNSAVDSYLVVKCADPRLAQALVPALIPLMSLFAVHIVGSGREVRVISTNTTYMALVQQAKTFQRSLEMIACTIEGRPAPAFEAPPAAPSPYAAPSI